MDEKESLQEKPSEDEGKGSGDNATAEKPNAQKQVEATEASGSGDTVAKRAALTDTSSNVIQDSEVDKTELKTVEEGSELQNHVDNDVITEDSNSVKSDGGSKKDVTDTTDVESQEDAKDNGMYSSTSNIFSSALCTFIPYRTKTCSF